MNKEELNKLRFPVGKFSPPVQYTTENRSESIQTLKELPEKLDAVTHKLDKQQLDTPYRPDGWTVQELVHHIADSHMNSYSRFKLGMTEDLPSIKPYQQDAWVKTSDNEISIEAPLSIIKGVHAKMVGLISSFSEADFNRKVFHPEMKKEISLDLLNSLYAWHSRHHLAHITELIKREGW